MQQTHTRSEKLSADTTVTAVFKSSLDRAFRTPMMGDASKILIAFSMFPLVAGFAKDDTWGRVGGSRIPIVQGFLFFKAREMGFDQIFEREENRYWKWGVSQFSAMLFFSTENCGEWWVTDNNDGTISVKWKYTWFSRNIITHPLNWLFVKILWRNVMKNGMANIKQMAEIETPYIYNR